MLYNLIKFIILCILVYYSGFYLSKIIDYLFAPCDFKKHHYNLMFELVSEFTIVFIIYIIINKYIFKKYDKNIYNIVQFRNKEFIQSFLATSFSYGIYKNLDTCFENFRFLKNKLIS